jgi:hypothetical protein
VDIDRTACTAMVMEHRNVELILVLNGPALPGAMSLGT